MKELEKEFIDLFKTLFKSMGMPDQMVRIVAQLYIEPDAIPLDVLAKKTGYSLASISNTIKMLENAGMVKKTRRPGSKKIFVSMEKNLARLNISKLRAANEFFIRPAKQKLPEIIKKYKPKVKDEESKKKLQVMESYYKQIMKFEVLIKKWTKELEDLAIELDKV